MLVLVVLVLALPLLAVLLLVLLLVLLVLLLVLLMLLDEASSSLDASSACWCASSRAVDGDGSSGLDPKSALATSAHGSEKNLSPRTYCARWSGGRPSSRKTPLAHTNGVTLKRRHARCDSPTNCLRSWVVLDMAICLSALQVPMKRTNALFGNHAVISLRFSSGRSRMWMGTAPAIVVAVVAGCFGSLMS